VVVDDLDVVRPAFLPDEANSPLSVHPDRVLASPILRERFELISRRDSEILQTRRRMQHRELPKRYALDVVKLAAVLASPYDLRLRAAEALDHPLRVLRYA
jgi:hypothetical protein